MVSPPLWFKDYLQVLCYYIVISILSFVELRIMVPFEDLTLPFDRTISTQFSRKPYSSLRHTDQFQKFVKRLRNIRLLIPHFMVKSVGFPVKLPVNFILSFS